jgi:hypothetical protein
MGDPHLQQALYARKLVEPIAIEGLEQIGCSTLLRHIYN